VYRQARAAGYRAAFVDLDQLGFHRPVPVDDPGNHRLKAANLAAVWRIFRDSGATCLIAVGPVDDAGTVPAYAAALPSTTVTLCRLDAGPERFTERVLLRGGGTTPAAGLPGDELKGQPVEALRRIAQRSAAQARALAAAGVGDLRVDADDRPPEEIAAEILRRAAWPPAQCSGRVGGRGYHDRRREQPPASPGSSRSVANIWYNCSSIRGYQS
jgi:hypothetical protein